MFFVQLDIVLLQLSYLVREQISPVKRSRESKILGNHLVRRMSCTINGINKLCGALFTFDNSFDEGPSILPVGLQKPPWRP